MTTIETKEARLNELQAEIKNITDELLGDENISDTRDAYLRSLRIDARREMEALKAEIDAEIDANIKKVAAQKVDAILTSGVQPVIVTTTFKNNRCSVNIDGAKVSLDKAVTILCESELARRGENVLLINENSDVCPLDEDLFILGKHNVKTAIRQFARGEKVTGAKVLNGKFYPVVKAAAETAAEPAVEETATIETKIAKNETLICKFNGKRVAWHNALAELEINPVGTVVAGNGHSYTCITNNVPASDGLTYETGYLFEDENGNRYIFDNSAFAIRAIAYNNVDEYAVTQDATVEETANAETEPVEDNPRRFMATIYFETVNGARGCDSVEIPNAQLAAQAAIDYVASHADRKVTTVYINDFVACSEYITTAADITALYPVEETAIVEAEIVEVKTASEMKAAYAASRNVVRVHFTAKGNLAWQSIYHYGLNDRETGYQRISKKDAAAELAQFGLTTEQVIAVEKAQDAINAEEREACKAARAEGRCYTRLGYEKVYQKALAMVFGEDEPATVEETAASLPESPASVVKPLNFTAKIIYDNGCTDARFASYDEAYSWIKDQENVFPRFNSTITFFNRETLDAELLYQNSNDDTEPEPPNNDGDELIDTPESAPVEERNLTRRELEACKNSVMAEIDEYREGLIEYQDAPDVNPTHIDFLKSSIDSKLAEYYDICKQLDELDDEPNPKPGSPFAIARGLDDVFRKTFHRVAAPYLDVTTQDGAKIVTNFGAAFISVDWRATDGYVFGNHFNDVLARYETPEQVTDVMTALRDAIRAGKTEFTFPTVEELTAPPEPDDAKSTFDRVVKTRRHGIGHVTTKQGRHMWYIYGRLVNKKEITEWLADEGFTVEEYIAAEKVADKYEEEVEFPRRMAIREQAEFLWDKIADDRKASVEPMPALYPSDDSDDDDELIDPPEVKAPADEFTAKLAAFDAEITHAETARDAAKAAYDKADIDAQNAIAARQDFLDKTAGVLTEKLHAIPPHRDYIGTATLSGCPVTFMDFDNVYVDATLGGKFKFVTFNNRELARYDTPAQVETVIGKLKDAVARHKPVFHFPTVDELNAPPEPPKTESVKARKSSLSPSARRYINAREEAQERRIRREYLWDLEQRFYPN